MSAQTPRRMPDPKLERNVIPKSFSKPQSDLSQLKVLRDGLAAAVAAPGTSDPTSFPEAVASAPCDDASLTALTKALKPLWKWPMDVDGLREAQAIGLIKLLKALKSGIPRSGPVCKLARFSTSGSPSTTTLRQAGERRLRNQSIITQQKSLPSAFRTRSAQPMPRRRVARS